MFLSNWLCFKKDVVRFQDADNLLEINIDSIYHHPEIQVNDILKIDLAALEPESLMLFSLKKLSCKQNKSSY